MLDVLLTEEQKSLRDEVRAFARDDVPRQLILDMDAERVRRRWACWEDHCPVSTPWSASSVRR